MQIDSQVAAVKTAQGALLIEQRLLGEAFVGSPAPTSSPGVNATMQLALASGEVVFHKPFSGVHVANAIAYGQTDETPPLHEAVAWRLAVALGDPWQGIVAPCVLREYAGADGSLSLQASGWPRDPAPTTNPMWCLPAAFFDALIAQQDRHDGNWRWDGERLTLIDHGYTFALPGDIPNHYDFVEARRAGGATGLLAEERDALDRLVAGTDLLGMARFLLPERARALADRAQRMLARGEILQPREF
ncbi:MAG TPA: hypothetical protein VGX26_04115 [Solirubrobacteraceae bacterium]|jgi:hypothetical protein|nr:hypothetical protein [Solirubrobacteraceae bacterium]